MAFPVIMYECENWTIKKAECQRIAKELMLLNCVAGEDFCGAGESPGQQGDQTSTS